MSVSCEAVAKSIGEWIRKTVDSAGSAGVVIGVSGGIDAAVCVALSVGALGVERVTAVIIRTTDSEDEFGGAIAICSCFNLQPIVLDYRAVYDTLVASLPTADLIAQGNFRDRIRSAVLYYLANMQGRLVMSTVNKNEYLLGYFCKNGSGTADLMPLGDLYKTDVWNLGKHLGVPQEIVNKRPSGDYWPGQTDEDIIGVPYSQQEQILRKIEKGDLPPHMTDGYERLQNLVKHSAHKRQFTLRCILPRGLGS